jgi:hypothetical protein
LLIKSACDTFDRYSYRSKNNYDELTIEFSRVESSSNVVPRYTGFLTVFFFFFFVAYYIGRRKKKPEGKTENIIRKLQSISLNIRCARQRVNVCERFQTYFKAIATRYSCTCNDCLRVRIRLVYMLHIHIVSHGYHIVCMYIHSDVPRPLCRGISPSGSCEVYAMMRKRTNGEI